MLLYLTILRYNEVKIIFQYLKPSAVNIENYDLNIFDVCPIFIKFSSFRSNFPKVDILRKKNLSVKIKNSKKVYLSTFSTL